MNGSIVPHPHDRLELLDITSKDTESIILHIMHTQNLSFFMNMIPDFYLLVALRTIITFKGIIQDRTIEPSIIVNMIDSLCILSINRVRQVVGLVQFCAIDEDVFRIICSMNLTSCEIVVSSMWFVGEGQVEFIVTKNILEY